MRRVTFAIVIASTAFGQEPKLHDERLVCELMDHYGLSGREKLYAPGQTEASSLSPMLPWLERRLGPLDKGVLKQTPLRSFRQSFAEVLREDTETKVFNGVTLHLRLADTLEGAGRLVVDYFSRIQVLYDKGSFSGMPVGDFIARSAWGGIPHIVFTRKNAFVHLSCDPAIELSKRDRSRSSVPDPGVKQRCEDLARDIDAELLKLPNIEKEVK